MLNKKFIPGFNALGKDLPAKNMMQFMQLGQEAMRSLIKIVQMEVENFKDSDLEQIAREVVQKILEGSGSNPRGIKYSDFTFDIEFVREMNDDLGSGVPKLPKTFEEPKDEALRNAVYKREIINAFTQGFALTNQARIFDQDLDPIIEPIGSDLLEEYFRFMRTSLESHKYLDIDAFISMLRMMQNMPPGAGGAGQIVPARMEIEYVHGKPIIRVKAYCLILVIQEMVKGVFEIISHNGLKYDRNILREIYDRTENWVIEQQGFVYGPIMVNLFKEYWNNLQNMLISNGVIYEYDDSMIPPLLAMLYDKDFVTDSKFLDIMGNIFNENLDKEMWSYNETYGLYSLYIEHMDHSTQVSDNELGEIMENYVSSAPVEDEEIQEHPVNEERSDVPDITMDDLLDKINESGYDSLTPSEKDLLKKLSSDVMD